MASSAPGRTDGRTARRDRNREEVVHAALELLDQGISDPTIADLTGRSGLSARSIFRYFDGLDDLRRAVIRSHFEQVRPMLESPGAGDGALEGRIRRFVDSRLKFNEAITGTARTARMRIHAAPVLAADIHEFRQVLDASVRQYFAPELKRRSRSEADDVAAVIHSIVSHDSWALLSNDYGRSRTQIRRAWTLALERLLAA